MSASTAIDIDQLTGRLQLATSMLGEPRPENLLMRVGKIARKDWRIRKNPLPREPEIAMLHLGDAVLVEQSRLGRPGDKLSWLHVFAQPQKSGSTVIEGWVRSDGVLLDPPDPESKVEFIEKGDILLNIAARHYKYYNPILQKDVLDDMREMLAWEWGADARFYVAALAYVNRENDAIINGKALTDADFRKRDTWKNINIRANHGLWIPKKAHLAPLHGSFVTTGSMTFEMWMQVRSVGAKLWEGVISTAASLAGLVHGVLLGIYDALTEVADFVRFIWTAYKSTFVELFKEAKQLFETLQNIDWGQLAGGIYDDFLAKWNAADTWDRFYFQGTCLGYLLATVVIGMLTWTLSLFGKAGKLLRMLQKLLPRYQAVDKILENAIVKRFLEKAEQASEALKERLAAMLKPPKKTAPTPWFEVIKGSEGPLIPGTSIPEYFRIRVGKREWQIYRDKHKLGFKSGAPTGPVTKHLAERTRDGLIPKLTFAHFSGTDFPISSLAGALEEAEKRLLAKTALSNQIFYVEGWELVVDTAGQVWRLQHAKYNSKINDKVVKESLKTPGAMLDDDKIKELSGTM